jgi:hypothetical protein
MYRSAMAIVILRQAICLRRRFSAAPQSMMRHDHRRSRLMSYSA